jgi:uncharacterized repeat protein (TIGR03803 family)
VKTQRTFGLVGVLLVVGATVAPAQNFSVLFDFGTSPGDPINASNSGIIAQGTDGNLYSTSFIGGASAGHGAIFMTTPGGESSTVYSFTGAGDGTNPLGGLTLGTDGNFYGTTGGTNGTIFKVTPTGGLTTLHTFSFSDGATPYSPPIQATDGNFYGTTEQGGAFGYGTVYRISPFGAFATLHDFDFAHGALPYAPLLEGSNGTLYGTASAGGSNDAGVVFNLTTAGDFAVVSSFSARVGARPLAPLIQGWDGNFYGTASEGGGNGAGVVFKMTPGGAISVLHSMNLSTDGGWPYAGLIQASDGNFYGVNSSGGSSANCGRDGCGTIFEVTPAGVFSVLHNFDGPTGSEPVSTLIQHTNGSLYGDTFCGGPGGGIGFCTPEYSGGVFYDLNTSLPPFVSFLPQLGPGKVGKSIEILGQGFTGASAVSFNGMAAKFEVQADTFLTATVPSGATTGTVTVTETTGMLASNNQFRVIPQLLSFTPRSGPAGTQVTITGVSLTQTSRVGFGNEVPASDVTVVSDVEIKAKVPPGAVTGPVGIETKGGIAISKQSFKVTN